MAEMYFTCDACKHNIAPTNPRIRCLDCTDYDLCTNCAVGERFTGGHVAAHRTAIWMISGGGAQVAIPSSTRIVYATAPPLAPASLSAVADGWGPFFSADMAPTPVFTRLMGAILSHLDTENTGHLVPETYSRFLDDLGYPADCNTCELPLAID